MSTDTVEITDAPLIGEPSSDVPTVEDTTKHKRGRSRSNTTIDRDEVALALIVDSGIAGLTRDALAIALTEKTGTHVSSNKAYLCINRLKRDGKLDKVQGGGQPNWVSAENHKAAVAAAHEADAVLKSEKAKAFAEAAAIAAQVAAETAAVAAALAQGVITGTADSDPPIVPAAYVG